MFFEVGCCRFDVFFKQGDNAQKWTVVNSAAITADSKGISEWLEDITLNQTIETRFASGNPNKVEFFYDNQKIATADKDGTIETFDNGLKEGDYTDADIIAPQYGGNKGIVCVQRGGAKLCGIAGGACFVAGTLVQTPTGAKNIETIQAGDTIIAYDTKQLKNVYSKVRQTFKRGVTQLYQVIIGKDTLNTTAEHPFFTTKGWQPAIQLKKGMKILTLASALLAVDTVFAFDSLATVYNFEVAEQHNYFVGSEGVLVHNSYIRPIDELLPNGTVPSVRNYEFHEWFDNLTPEELDFLWADSKIREKIEDRIRHPGGLHEWLMVAETPKLKEWDVSMYDVKEFRTSIELVEWINPNTGLPGRHGGDSSTIFHNELQAVIQNSNSRLDFNNRLDTLLERWQIDSRWVPSL